MCLTGIFRKVFQGFNILMLAVLAGSTFYYLWPSIKAQQWPTDGVSIAQYIGGASSLVALVVGLVFCACSGPEIGGLGILLAVIEAGSYGYWAAKEDVTKLCSSAAGAVGEVPNSGAVTKLINCSWGQIKTAIIAFLVISCILQLSVSVLAIGCMSGGTSQSLGKATGYHHIAHSLPKMRFGRQQARWKGKGRAMDGDDEEAGLPLREEGIEKRGGRDAELSSSESEDSYHEDDEKRAGTSGRRGKRASVAV
ncbi:hypothetical protein OF846_003511 [Rhodotorula toruloides]|nr:hypothetical protein OF846_003511 [Rhodotorula toruloides]